MNAAAILQPVYREHRVRMLAALIRVLGDFELAEDALQDACVRAASYRITEADMDRLTADGCSEDQIFEVTVAAAVGAALHSFDTGRNALARMTAG